MRNNIDPREVEQLREENKRLQVLLHLAENLQTHLELDKLLLTTMEEVAKILNADRCTVFLLDENKNELWSIVAMGIEKGKEIRFPADKGISGYVATTGQVLNIPDAYKDPRFNPDIDKKTGYKTENMLTMPLSNAEGHILGVFQVLNKKDGPFTERDESLLTAISHIAATTIENSQLY
ncbi:MAG: GAF domain-containing protein, partial [Calditrichota bacterium]